MKDKKEFGLFIQQKRKEKGYSQKELSEILYISESAVSKWERGVSYPDITMISDIAKALDISEGELINASYDTEYRKLRKEAKIYNKISTTWFYIPTISYIVALVVCFICNLAVNHKLSWFFVVFASLLCAFCFVPTVTRFFKKQKLTMFFASSFLSIVILFITCGIYTKSIYWVGIASVSVLLGYIVFFLPIVLYKYNFPKIVKQYKWLIAFFSDTVLCILLLLVINITYPMSLGAAILTTLYSFLPFICLGLIVSTKISKLLKAGILVILFGVIYYGLDFVISKLWKYQTSYTVDFTNWKEAVNGNVYLISLISCLIVGITFIAIYVYRYIKNKR